MSTKAVVRINEMPPEMAEEAFIHGMDALETQFNESDMAAYVKEKFEEQYGGLWHCFVGRNFGAFVTHEENKIIYFYIQQTGFLLFGTVIYASVLLCTNTQFCGTMLLPKLEITVDM